jgi:hypothetical protein
MAQMKLFYQHENLIVGLVAALGNGVICEIWVSRE